MSKTKIDKYGRGSAAANGVGFVDLAPGDTFDGVLGIRHFDKKAVSGQRWIIRFVRVFSSFVFDGIGYVATVTLKEDKNVSAIYSVEALDIKKDTKSERTPRSAMSEDLNAAPLQIPVSLMARSIAYYVGECNRTHPEFINRTESFSVDQAALLLVNLLAQPAQS